MRTTINTISTIDFNNITTYGELKNVLPSTGTSRVPGINQLREKAAMVLHRDTESGVIEIYDNGFFTFEEGGHLTVYGVDRCEWPQTYAPDGRKERGAKQLNLSSYPWEMILESAGSSRLSHNGDSREESREDISIDAPESENNIALSVKPEHEIREEEEEMAAWHKAQIEKKKKILEDLTEKQLEAITLKRVKGLTQEQIAEEMGLSRAAVRNHHSYDEKKINQLRK